ncbi:hypothetical protein DFJ74DRAFT_306593 [Hyaloraphidium curvatum]|nr:hypothetical protein DFJ74DRAFT_306593 [Hyaloraphidium curvatum]
MTGKPSGTVGSVRGRAGSLTRRMGGLGGSFTRFQRMTRGRHRGRSSEPPGLPRIGSGARTWRRAPASADGWGAKFDRRTCRRAQPWIWISNEGGCRSGRDRGDWDGLGTFSTFSGLDSWISPGATGPPRPVCLGRWGGVHVELPRAHGRRGRPCCGTKRDSWRSDFGRGTTLPMDCVFACPAARGRRAGTGTRSPDVVEGMGMHD